jgi:hypothetical protein
MTTTENAVRVGTGVWIFKDGKILLGKRKGNLALFATAKSFLEMQKTGRNFFDA